MSTLKKDSELKGLQDIATDTKTYVWTLNMDLRNAIAEYRSYINGGISGDMLDKKINTFLYRHLKKNHRPGTQSEEVELTQEEISNLGLNTFKEFEICMQTIGNILSGRVKIEIIDFSTSGKIVFTLLK